MTTKKQKRKDKVIDVFTIINTIIMVCAAASCIIPFIHVLSISFSSASKVAAGQVYILPKNFTLSAYKYVSNRAQFWKSAFISVKRVLLGVPTNLLLIVLTAYPLSRPIKKFKMRTFFAWFFFITNLFSGGLIPVYIIVATFGLINSVWALILPSAVNVGNILLMLNFFRRVPTELHEAATMDGIGHWRMLFKIYIPLSMASIATMVLFNFISHWNAWFDGMIYMSRQDLYPLQTFIRNISILSQDLASLPVEEQLLVSKISDRTLQSAQIMIATLPIILIYPFLQRYFVKGLTLGSVKG